MDFHYEGTMDHSSGPLKASLIITYGDYCLRDADIVALCMSERKTDRQKLLSHIEPQSRGSQNIRTKHWESIEDVFNSCLTKS